MEITLIFRDENSKLSAIGEILKRTGKHRNRESFKDKFSQVYKNGQIFAICNFLDTRQVVCCDVVLTMESPIFKRPQHRVATHCVWIILLLPPEVFLLCFWPALESSASLAKLQLVLWYSHFCQEADLLAEQWRTHDGNYGVVLRAKLCDRSKGLLVVQTDCVAACLADRDKT